MNIPRRQPLHSHRNFGFPPRLEDNDEAPFVIVWIAIALASWGLVFATVEIVRHWS